MDKFLKNYIAIALLIIIFVIVVVTYKFNPSIVKSIPFLSVSSNAYKKACANYITIFLDVNYHKEVTFNKKGIDSASISRLQVNYKKRKNLGDKNNKINVVVVKNLKANIENDFSYNIICWVNSRFKDDPSKITSYDILKIEISKPNDKSSLKILEENY